MQSLYKHFLNSTGISTDSRNIPKGSIFFALKGEHFDGNQFAGQALSDGAAFAVVDDRKLSGNPQFIIVDNVYETLINLAKYHRNMLQCPVFAITGTNGKTTTKELIVQVLSTDYNITYTKGNLNNHIGLPLTVLSANAKTEILILEMGANHPGDIDFLCNIGRPDYGLITNIGKAHLEGFGSPEAVFQTKTELYRFIADHGKGLIVHADDHQLMHEAGKNTLLSYGINSGNITGNILSSVPYLNISWLWENKENSQHTNLFGAYNIYNVLAAVATGLFFKVSPKNIIHSIAAYQPTNNRSQYFKSTKNSNIILDAYNANPSSMNLALDEFFLLNGTPKYAILGSMMELGKYSQSEHLNILQKLMDSSVDHVFLVGNEFKQFRDDYPCFTFFENSDSLNDFLKTLNISEAYILLKGSRINALEKTLPYL